MKSSLPFLERKREGESGRIEASILPLSPSLPLSLSPSLPLSSLPRLLLSFRIFYHYSNPLVITFTSVDEEEKRCAED
jgi:hypothetical protein